MALSRSVTIKRILFILLPVLFFLAGYKLFFSSPQVTNSLPRGHNIICFGDSLTYGTGANENMDYPSQLSRLISRPVINAGIPGDTTSSALDRLEKDVLHRSPRIVLITLGGNDLKNRVSKETTFTNLKRIIDLIHNRDALVVVGGISIPFWGRGFGSAYEKLSNETGSILIPNTIMANKFYEAIEPYL